MLCSSFVSPEMRGASKRRGNVITLSLCFKLLKGERTNSTPLVISCAASSLYRLSLSPTCWCRRIQCTGAANKICKTQLSRTQSGPCSIAKEEQKQISPNHVQALFALYFAINTCILWFRLLICICVEQLERCNTRIMSNEGWANKGWFEGLVKFWKILRDMYHIILQGVSRLVSVLRSLYLGHIWIFWNILLTT